MTDGLKQFLEAAEGDAALAAKLEATKTPQDFLALAAEKGFALSREDLSSLTAPTGELSDDELDDVAGGLSLQQLLDALLPRIGFLRFLPASFLHRSSGEQTPAANDLVHFGGPVQATTLPLGAGDKGGFVKL